MKIVFITPEWPYPLDQGGRIRMYYFLRHLAQWHELHLVSGVFGQLNDSWVEAVRPYCQSYHLVWQSHSIWHTTWRIWRSLGNRRPYILSKYLSPHLTSTIQQVVALVKPDRVVVESQYISEAVRSISVPSLVDLHDVATILYERFAINQHWDLKKVHGYLQKPLIQRFEANLPYHFSKCVTTSTTDQRRLQLLSGANNIDVVSNGVDVAEFHPHWSEKIPYDIVFVGSMDYHPNIDAALHLAKDIMPLIWQTRPKTTVAIVGRNPTKAVQALGDHNRLDVTGTVPDVRPYLAGASVVIIPLRSGSGTRLKALMAAAMGKAIVSTSVGLEGLDLVPNHHVLIAENAENTASTILYLLANPSLRQQLGTAARSLVENVYSWEACTLKLNEVLHTL